MIILRKEHHPISYRHDAAYTVIFTATLIWLNNFTLDPLVPLVIVSVMFTIFLGFILHFLILRPTNTDINKILSLPSKLEDGKFLHLTNQLRSPLVKPVGKALDLITSIISSIIGKMLIASQQVSNAIRELIPGVEGAKQAAEQIASSIQDITESAQKQSKESLTASISSKAVLDLSLQISKSTSLVSQFITRVEEAVSSNDQIMNHLLRSIADTVTSNNISIEEIKELLDMIKMCGKLQELLPLLRHKQTY